MSYLSRRPELPLRLSNRAQRRDSPLRDGQDRRLDGQHGDLPEQVQGQQALRLLHPRAGRQGRLSAVQRFQRGHPEEQLQGIRHFGARKE